MQPTTPTVFGDIPLPQPDENRYAHDANMVTEFFRKPVHMEFKSREAGRAIYDEKDYIRIYTPGDKTSVCERPVSTLDEQRFADRYAKWKVGQEQAVMGTPITVMPGITPSKAEEYRYFKIFTVEQLAEAPDNLGQKFMSFQQDKQRAKAFLQVAANNAPIEKMNEELEKRDVEIENLKAMVEALQAQTKPSRRNLAPSTDAS